MSVAKNNCENSVHLQHEICSFYGSLAQLIWIENNFKNWKNKNRRKNTTMSSPKKKNYLTSKFQEPSSFSKIAQVQIHTKENPIPPNIRTIEPKGFIALRNKVFQICENPSCSFCFSCILFNLLCKQTLLLFVVFWIYIDYISQQ